MATTCVLERAVDRANAKLKNNLTSLLTKLKEEHGIELSTTNYRLLSAKDVKVVNNFFTSQVDSVLQVDGLANELLFLERNPKGSEFELRFNPRFDEMVKGHILAQSRGELGYLSAESALAAKRKHMSSEVIREHYKDEKESLYEDIIKAISKIKKVIQNKDFSDKVLSPVTVSEEVFTGLKDNYYLMREVFSNSSETEKFKQAVESYSSYILNAVSNLRGFKNYLDEISDDLNSKLKDVDSPVTKASETDFLRAMEISELADSYSDLFSGIITLTKGLKSDNTFVAMYDEGIRMIDEIRNTYTEIASNHVTRKLFEVNNTEVREINYKRDKKALDAINKEIAALQGKTGVLANSRRKALEVRKVIYEERVKKLEFNFDILKNTLLGKFGDISTMMANYVSHSLNGDAIIHSIGEFYSRLVGRINKVLIPYHKEFGKMNREYRKNSSGHLVNPQDWNRKFVSFRKSYRFNPDLVTEDNDGVDSRTVIDYLNPFPPEYISKLEELEAKESAISYKMRSSKSSDVSSLIEEKSAIQKEIINLKLKYGTNEYPAEYYEIERNYEAAKAEAIAAYKMGVDEGILDDELTIFDAYENLDKQIRAKRNETLKVGKFRYQTRDTKMQIHKMRVKQSQLRNDKFHKDWASKKREEYNSTTILESDYQEQLAAAEDLYAKGKIDQEDYDFNINRLNSLIRVTEEDQRRFESKLELGLALKLQMSNILLERQERKRGFEDWSLKHTYPDGTVHDGYKEWEKDMDKLKELKKEKKITEEQYQSILEDITDRTYDDDFSQMMDSISNLRASVTSEILRLLKDAGIINETNDISHEGVREALETAGEDYRLEAMDYTRRRLLVAPYRNENKEIQADMVPKDTQLAVKELDERLEGKSSGINKIINNMPTQLLGGLTINQYRSINISIRVKNANITKAKKQIVKDLGIAEKWKMLEDINLTSKEQVEYATNPLYHTEYEKQLTKFASEHKSSWSNILLSGKHIYLRHGSKWYKLPYSENNLNTIKAKFNDDPDNLLKDEKEFFDFQEIRKLQNESAEKDFKNEKNGWYQRNHYTSYWSGKPEQKHTYIWTSLIPKDKEMAMRREKKAVPSNKYRVKSLKPEYKNKNQYDSQLGSYLPNSNMQDRRYVSMMRARGPEATLLSKRLKFHKEASSVYPPSKQLGYRIPYRDKSISFKSFSWEDGFYKNVKGGLHTAMRSLYINEQDINEELGGYATVADASGVKYNSIPHYLSAWTEPDLVDLDLDSVGFAYLAASKEYEMLNEEFSPVTKAMVDVMSKPENTPVIKDRKDAAAFKVASKLSSTVAKKMGESEAFVVKQEGNLNKRLEMFLRFRNMWEYGIHIDPEKDWKFQALGKTFSITKLAAKLRGLKSVSILGASPLGKFLISPMNIARETANNANSLAMSIINSANKEGVAAFSLPSFLLALKDYVTTHSWSLFWDYYKSRVEDKSKIGRMMDYFNVLDSKLVDDYGQTVNNRSRLQFLLNGDFMFLLKNAAELGNYATVFLAFMHDTKVSINGEKMSLYEAYSPNSSGEVSLRRGNVKLLIRDRENPKEYIPVEYNEDFIRTNLQKLLQITQGNYAASSKTVAETTAVGAGLLWMKKFMPPFLIHMWGTGRIDVSEQDIRTGYFATTLRLVAEKLLSLNQISWREEGSILKLGGDLTPMEVTHLKMFRNWVIIVFVLSMLLKPMFFDYDEEDEDRLKKIRDRKENVSGGEFLNWALYTTLKVRSEVTSLQDPTEFTRTIKTSYEGVFPFLSDANRMLSHDIDWSGWFPTLKKTTRDKFGYEKGSYKLFISLLHLIPGTKPSHGDAAETIKNWESIRRR